MRLHTIGFTKKPAQRFFDLLRSAGVKRVVDVRLNNSSQLAGFAKRDDLAWFLREIGGMDYTHVPALAPTQALLSAYRKAEVDWPAYEQRFPRPHARAAHRGNRGPRAARRRLPALQRRPAPPMPPPARRRVPAGTVGNVEVGRKGRLAMASRCRYAPAAWMSLRLHFGPSTRSADNNSRG